MDKILVALVCVDDGKITPLTIVDDQSAADSFMRDFAEQHMTDQEELISYRLTGHVGPI
jgi:hypothetical protein